LILPACNTEAMNLHLIEIAKAVAPGAHAVLLADQAGWHMSTRLVVPPNITVIALPPKCRELNPVENVWQFMRENWLSNRVFQSYDDLVDHCCAAWNKLTAPLVEFPFRNKVSAVHLPRGPSRGPCCRLSPIGTVVFVTTRSTSKSSSWVLTLASEREGRATPSLTKAKKDQIWQRANALH
jgi:DDE superfamily endonuclease